MKQVRDPSRCLAVLALFSLFGGTAAAEEPTRGDIGLLLTGVTLVSPERSTPLADAWVLVRGERIAAVGSGEPPIEAGEGLRRVQADGLFLVPGLIDAHVHLRSVPGMAWPQQQAHPELVEAYFRQLPRSYLLHGFTTLIDLATEDPGFLAELAAEPEHPDLFGCAGPLVLANGYPMVFAPSPQRFELFANFLWDPAQAERIPGRFAAADHTPAAAVSRVVEAGGICVKTFVEDGFGPAKIWPVPSRELLAEVAAEAHRRQLPLAVHANSSDAYGLALEGGADVLVHGLWAWDDAAAGRDGGEDLPPQIRDLLQRVIASRTAVMPTLRVLAGDRALFDPEFLADPALAEVLPPQLLAWYRGPEGSWFAEQMLADHPPEMRSPEAAYQAHTEAMSRVERATAYLARQGGRLLFGSDTPSGPSYGNPPGYNGLLELRALAAAGVPLPRLLAAATLDNARAFRLDDLFGSVEPGKVANLLLLSKDPL